MAKKLFIADRDFDHFQRGEVVELEEDDPYTRTGYLDEYTPEAAAPEGEELPPALSATTVEPVTDGEGDAGGDAPDEGGAGPKPRTRSRG